MAFTAPVVSHGDPALDARSFRRCLGMFATGVTVITAQSGDQRAGVTANSFSALSLDPPLILWCINRSARSFPIFRDATHFAVNVLAASQIDVSQCFSSAEPTGSHDAVATGRRRSAIARGCRRPFRMQHRSPIRWRRPYNRCRACATVFSLRGPRARICPGSLWNRGRPPEPRRERTPTANEPGDVMQDSPTLRLLFHALHFMHAEFEQSRLGEGLTIAQIRVLNGLYDIPGLSVQQLSERMYLGAARCGRRCWRMVESGDVARVERGTLELTPAGRGRRETIRRKIREFEKMFLADIPESEVAIGRRFLERLIAKRSVAPSS